MPDERDRDQQGRARNARPRDALGRPMPRGSTGGVPEEDLPGDPDQLLAIGIAHFNAQRFFQAHEAWETAWHPSADDERDFWQGITQVAVGFTHLQRGNAAGAVTLLRRGATRITAYAPVHRGVRVAALAAAAHRAADTIESDGLSTPITFPTIDP